MEALSRFLRIRTARLKARLRKNLLTGATGAALSILVGLCVWLFRIGEPLSYDLPFLFVSEAVTNDVIIVTMDEASNQNLDQTAGLWDRRIHARLLDKLRADQSEMAVFDVLFADPGNDEENAELARAIKAHANVVLGVEMERLSEPEFSGTTIQPAESQLLKAARGSGIMDIMRDADLTVRSHYPGTVQFPSLPWVAAVFAGAPITNSVAERRTARWIRYYGPSWTILSLSYYSALEKPDGYFEGKIVFVGGKPSILRAGELSDRFSTLYTRWGRGLTSGVEIHATIFLNLMRGDSLARLSVLKELSLLLLAGLVFGYGLTVVRPLIGAGLVLLATVGVPAFAFWLFWQWHVWFSWLEIAGFQVPCAFAWSVLSYTTRLDREKEEMKKELASTRFLAGAVQRSLPNPVIQPDAGTPRSPSIPDHALVRCVGEGAFGQVWLARNTIGMFHAVKIVSRQTFEDAGPDEREFKGIEKYMPISLNHPGLVTILHVGRNDKAGYFYSIMEAADDEVTGQKIDPDTYSPRTLSKDLQRHGRIPVEECLSLGLALTTGLDYLHWQQLIHRDIKPSNIIFVNGIPKLADIGLVTDIRRKDKDVSNLGTEGYMAPEGAGTPSADLYSLGKVIYVASMGKSVHDYPALPTNLDETAHQAGLLQLNQIILKACEEDAQKRYQSAEEMRVDLLRLQNRLKLRKS